jgi:cell division protein FtsI (penicillin-binding protein 3)
MDSARYRTLSQQQRLTTIPLAAVRGEITAADGSILAMTVQTDLVYADPTQMTVNHVNQRAQIAAQLAGPLGMTAADILNLITHPTSPQYVVLKQAVPAQTGSQIQALSLPGIAITPGYARAYPDGNLAAGLLGFTGTDSAGDLTGEAGLEYAYNPQLAGRPGSQRVEQSTDHQPIPLAGERVTAAVPGRSVRLTLQRDVQWEAEQACAQAVRQTSADSCTAVVMQPQTGQIIALAQSPTFDPAAPAGLAAATDMPVQDIFEPGSTAKVITAAAALERGGQTPMSAYTVPYQIYAHGFPFHDADLHPTEGMTLAGVLAHSSNVGMVQVVQHVSPQVQYQYLRAFGIGEPTGLNLPGDSPGILAPPSRWWGDQRYTLSFGQGVAVNAVQMASVYATIANGGVRIQPSIVAGTTSSGGAFTPAPAPRRQRVLQTHTAQELLGILQQVPTLDATLASQPWGVIPGYTVASKTGTAQIWDSKKKCLCQYGSSYIGIAPADNPQLVVAVNVQNPRKVSIYGNAVAGPVFYQVMKFALQSLKIPPDGAKPPNVRLMAP